jgi:hypothetical protein
MVETLELESGTEVRASSAYQMEFPPDLLNEFGVADAEWANVVLPVTTKEKRPLLRFDISTSHGAPAHLLNRRSNAAIEANYVRSLAEAGPTATNDLTGLSDELLEAMFVLTPQLFKQTVADYGRVEGISSYLASGIGLQVELDDVRRWLRHLEPAARTLLRALEEPADPLSPTENILIALPELSAAPTTTREVDELVTAYATAIAAADRAQDRELLSALGEYGRRWEMLVEVEVPLGRPFEIKISEDRPLKLEGGGWVWQGVAIGDALSAHIQISAPGTAVEIQQGEDNWGVKALDGTSLGLGIFESARLTRDTLAVYTSVRERPFFVKVGFKLRPALYIRWTAYVAILVTLSAAIAAIFISDTHDLMERLTVLSVPTTVGATIVLIREQSGLATRLNRWPRIILAATLLVLWVVMLVRVLDGGVRFHRHHRPNALVMAVATGAQPVTQITG